MQEFRVAGSAMGPDDEALLDQVVRIAGYSHVIHELVQKSFTDCPVHAKAIPKMRTRNRSAPTPSALNCPAGCVQAVPVAMEA